MRKEKKLLKGFKNEIYPLYYDKKDEEQMEFEKEEDEEQMEFEKEEEEKIYLMQINLMNGLSINKKLFKNYFFFQTPSVLLKELYKTDDKEKNKLLVSVINTGLKDLKEEISKMSKEERINKKSGKIVKIVKNCQEGQGLKILTPSQMFSRLPITLAQLKAEQEIILKNLKMK